MPQTDIVIAWVNGDDPAHQAKRAKYVSGGPAAESVATKSRRFSDNEEIRYGLRSIVNHAPWVRKVWIVTDNQFPPSIDPTLAAQFNIEVVDHRAIFEGFTGALPTFNSLSIETMLWRIPGLAEQFVYLNDDMLLTAPTSESDFFRDGRAVLRGGWVDRSEKVLSFHASNQIAAAKLFGHDQSHSFANHHVPYPMIKMVLAEAFDAMLPEFARNMSFRFRNRTQFWPISVHSYHALVTDRAVEYEGKPDWQHFSVKFCKEGTIEETLRRLTLIKDHRVKMACLNYFEAIELKISDATDYLSVAAGDVAPFEKTRP